MEKLTKIERIRLSSTLAENLGKLKPFGIKKSKFIRQAIEEKIERTMHDNIFFYKYKIYRDEKGVLCGDVWEISTLHASAKERVGYATQKPKELINRIIEASSNENDVVADFYLGCGTTAVVCKELNRKFIGCDINPKAIELTNKRLNETLF